MARRASTSDRLTDANLEKVSKLLTGEKPITKKAACEILGITYNTTRLDELIKKYKDKLAYRESMYAKKKGTQPEMGEIVDIVTSYLQGDSMTDISARNFRSPTFIKTILKDTGTPLREMDSSYFKPPMLEDEVLKREYKIGEKCYSARYQSLAEIISVHTNKDGDQVYSIWLESEDWLQYAYQPWWELASLDKIRSFGVKI